jgi:hypothetical protein
MDFEKQIVLRVRRLIRVRKVRYLRLRGHEIDAIDFKRKSVGNTYALQGHPRKAGQFVT